MEEKILFTALAGLLHDIGKFAQRAGETFSENSSEDFKYQHALGTYDFIHKFVPEIWHKELIGAFYHHKPVDAYSSWIQLADWLSSSERETDEDNKISRMQSIFSNLANFDEKRYLPLSKLNTSIYENLFPIELSDTSWKKTTEEEYYKLWDEFANECKALSKCDCLPIYLESIYGLMQQYTWSIPSAFWKSTPDVSLFDHGRSTAAIAACLAADDRPESWCKEIKNSNEAICLLVAGDISNLQAFIYTLASSGAAKSLRARSFYIQLITEAIAYSLLNNLDLPITNLIFIGGGGFQLLAPMSAEIELKNSARDLNDRLITVHQGALGLTIQWIPITAKGFEEFSKTRDNLNKELNRAKRQPFASASPNTLLEAIGQPLTQGGDALKFCHVTGEDGDTIKLDEDGEYKSKFVISLEELGRQLPKATHIVFTMEKPIAPSLATDWHRALQAFGMNAYLVTGESAKEIGKFQSDLIHVWRLDPTPKENENTLLKSLPENQRVITYRPFARLTPLQKGSNIPKTFDQLAKPKEGDFKRWGVLRLDVDNLGKLFREGLGEQATISRIASLSFSLRLFFEGWLPQLAKADDTRGWEDLSEYVYLQYSGGDDVFIVGAWDVLPDLALRIRQSFAEFTANNPALTLSGGMCMVEAGFPLYQAAEQAGEAENDAKGYKRINRKGQDVIKDAFNFMGISLGWDELEEAMNMAIHLEEAIKHKRMPASILQTLLSLYSQVEMAQREARHKHRNGKVPLFGRWSWMAAYQLTRAVQKIDKQYSEEKAYIEGLRDQFLLPKDNIKTIGLAARWAQYLTRGG